MAEYDLTQTLLAYLDPHLGFPLLAHLNTTKLFDAKELAKAQYELAKLTDMVDFTLQFHREAFPGEAEPSDVVERGKMLEEKKSKLEKEAERVLTVIEDPNVAAQLKQDKAVNMEWLQKNYQLTADQVNVLYDYGRFLFSCGKYKEASSYLYHYWILSPESKNTESCLWGRLACAILTGEWDRALDDVRLLREHIDAQRTTAPGALGQNTATHEEILQKRVWLLHWSLFVFFNNPTGRVKLVEMYLSPAYLSTMQMSCWWLLRYLVVALILTRRQATRGFVVDSSGSSQNTKMSTQAALREVSKVIQMESYRLRADPFVDFFRYLYVDLDFDHAPEELAKAEKAISTEFFLRDHATAFMEQARLLTTEVYCRIHQNVTVADLAKRVSQSPDECEKWLASLAADGKTDSKIEFKDGLVRINQSRPNVYQSVIDKTRGITQRTTTLTQSIERRENRVRKTPSRSDNADADVDVDAEAENEADVDAEAEGEMEVDAEAEAKAPAS
ncbi:eukaryotic translation initiation factor 3 subunit E [Malassezia pachydermatis]|uniref:Eukaryotic translation initiation factor 3 subunit E n=1 Tax=Malassezia pachydermatis TaxID=77020 RepID=A0A0M9VQI5_9BASI|nr:eukaryotic translation initiation factor 3 subunit 6 [Malassezia pachydermatis]KOS15565.1 eukaryotic translation initiation factor 3 subunit 6 [Malassezia pachydermatis]